MALPNLVGLLFLSGIIVKETRSYMERTRNLVDRGVD
jgi:Na+/alanine symporter